MSGSNSVTLPLYSWIAVMSPEHVIFTFVVAMTLELQTHRIKLQKTGLWKDDTMFDLSFEALLLCNFPHSQRRHLSMWEHVGQMRHLRGTVDSGVHSQDCPCVTSSVKIHLNNRVTSDYDSEAHVLR